MEFGDSANQNLQMIKVDYSKQDVVFSSKGGFKLHFVGTVSLVRTNLSYKSCMLPNGIDIFVAVRPVPVWQITVLFLPGASR